MLHIQTETIYPNENEFSISYLKANDNGLKSVSSIITSQQQLKGFFGVGVGGGGFKFVFKQQVYNSNISIKILNSDAADKTSTTKPTRITSIMNTGIACRRF